MKYNENKGTFMIRNVDFKDISDGKTYSCHDMAKLGCNDCSGCSACCQGMSDTIILDPYDMNQLMTGLGCTFDALIEKYVELRIVDGLILPNLMMNPETDQCNFLDENGRCRIHSIRPGICRLFPLGRIYENNTFAYFLQKDECKKSNRTKVKINKWLGLPNLPKYEKFISDWHYFLKDLGEEVMAIEDGGQLKKIQYMMLQLFYRTPYDSNRDFYDQFYERLAQVKK